MAGEDQERFEDYLELEHYIEELQVGRTAHPPSELTPTRARIYRMVALFRSASTEEGQTRPEFAAELQTRLEQDMKVKGETNTLKHLIAIFVALSLLTVVIASCGGSGGNSSGSGTDVHMGDTTFLQSSITISKGSSLNLIDDVAVTHIIGNGSWVNGVIKPAIEPGAPTVNNLTFNSAGQSMTVGPFNTAGTYHLYCSVHPNMNLTIIVQ